jgi:hypothetical protein
MNLFAGLRKGVPADFSALCGGSQGTFESLQVNARYIDGQYIGLYLASGIGSGT